jgi:alpha-beta hydrolase superfamily lysophospholipase
VRIGTGRGRQCGPQWAVVTIHIGGAPALLTSQQPPKIAARRGTVLVYHGFGGDKLDLEDLAGTLAAAGFLVVSIDIVGHGDRRLPNWDEVFSDERWAEAEDTTEAEFHSPHKHAERFYPVPILSHPAMPPPRRTGGA